VSEKTQDNTLNELAAILEEVAGVKPEDVTPDKSFVDDLDVDSLSMVEVAMAVEDKFGAKIPDDELSNLKTVGDAVAYIKGNRASAS
jgi:acyl carrier protein